jgi:hypothetical protein
MVVVTRTWRQQRVHILGKAPERISGTMNKPCANNAETRSDLYDLQSEPSEISIPVSLTSASPLRVMKLSSLAERCMNEMNKYRRGEVPDNQYGLELFRRAMVEHDSDAWTCVQKCFSEIVLVWLRRHPRREEAYRLDSEENYIAQAFERFWQATTCNQQLAFTSIAAALQYLHASLNGAILDTLRGYARQKEIPLPEPGFVEEPFVEEPEDATELWEVIQGLLPHAREKRLGYLLFYCGLKPRDIIRYRPQEFSDVREIYTLRRNIMERLLRNADKIRWRLGVESANV